MSAYENVVEILKEKKDEYNSNPDYRKFVERYKELLKRGLIKKQEYEIPPIDTIGTRRFQVEDKEE
jgi:predicted component of type VI protein secretion system